MRRCDWLRIIETASCALSRAKSTDIASPSTERVWQRLFSDQAGTITLLFGLLAVPIIAMIGGAVDYANAYRARSQLQHALDTATLAAGREADIGASAAEAKAVAETVLAANLGPDFPEYAATITVDLAANTVNGTVSSSIDTFILNIVGVSNFPIQASTLVKLPDGKVEIALVLDNSGSMGGSRISDLKAAASNLTEIVFASPPQPDFVKVAVVPFAASVNVGSQHANAPWMDVDGASSFHAENFDAPVTRWSLFDQLDDTSWAGCVEARVSPYDVTDEPAQTGNGDTYFVPLFAPDEPDNGWSYYNDYLDDDDGSCSGGGGEPDEVAQEKTCKYDGETPNGGSGPNYMCTSRAITPLTSSEGVVLDAIDDMIASGATNIMEGVMWGWRTLSPEEPFAEGRSYDEPDNRKIMIVMSDGANTHYGSWNQNMSRYSAFGYAKNGRLRSPTSNSSLLVDAMNDKTAQACTNAKAAGIIVYTVAFDISDSDTLALLEGCATSPARAFTIDNGDALLAVFEAIADDINKLRIAG